MFGWRALLRLKHIPSQAFDVTMFPVILLVMFTYLFGGALTGSTRVYLQSVLPGLLVMTIVMTTQSTGVALNSDITKGIFDRFRSLPIWQPAALAGALLADLGRYAISATVIVGVGTLLGFRTGIGLVISAPESMMFLGMMVTFPLTFVSNVFIDPATLPGWLEGFVNVNPITHLVTAVRGLMHGDPVGTEVGWVLLTCAVLVGVCAPVAMRLYRRER
ncbi:ABC transporter permease [Nocardia sp. CC227C]|uniref:ABC transporter permease n=1 Tax=Nocardia sp. CC227C TaxID=3044562 RepID=UPI00278BF6FE|nr:ABC transporter permease [Nocardia sp. CC227C]